MIKILKNTVFFILLLLLASCEEEACIDADDFGFPKFFIDAKGQNVVPPDTHAPDQVSEWTDSGLIITGTKLIIKVRPAINTSSTWTPFLNGATSPSNNCVWYNSADPTTVNTPERIVSQTFDLLNAQCWLRDGMLLYGLVTNPEQPGNQDPNSSEVRLRNPIHTTFHLGPRVGNLLGGVNEMPTASADGTFPLDLPTNGRLYFKVNDYYYSDNAGGFNIVIRGGAKDPNPGPFERVIRCVKNAFLGSSKFTSFKDDGAGSHVVDTNDECTMGNDDANKVGAAQLVYEEAIKHLVEPVKALLVIYVIFTAIMFIFGMIKMTQGQLVIHLAKIGLLLAFISPGSWAFFNEHLFIYFTDGTEQLMGLMVKTITDDPQGGLGFFDDIIKQLFSSDTTKKMLAIMFGMTGYHFFLGFAYAVLLYILMFIFAIALARAAVMYLVCLIVMAMLIIIAPLFFCFLLFKQTAGQFHNWVQQVFAFTIQPIILFAALALIGNLILEQLHRTIGYRVCLYQPFDFIPTFYLWHIDVRPDQVYVMPTPPYYEINDCRYEDFPFLDPDLSNNLGAPHVSPCNTPASSGNDWGTGITTWTDANNDGIDDVNGLFAEQLWLDANGDGKHDTSGFAADMDQEKIDKVKSGEYIEIQDILLLGVLIYVLQRFLALIPAISRGLSTTGGQSVKLSNANVDKFLRIPESIVKTLVDRHSGTGTYDGTDADGRGIKDGPPGIKNVIRRKITLQNLRHSAQDAIGSKIDTAKNSLPGKFINDLSEPNPFGGLVSNSIKTGKYVSDKLKQKDYNHRQQLMGSSLKDADKATLASSGAHGKLSALMADKEAVDKLLSRPDLQGAVNMHKLIEKQSSLLKGEKATREELDKGTKAGILGIDERNSLADKLGQFTKDKAENDKQLALAQAAVKADPLFKDALETVNTAKKTQLDLSKQITAAKLAVEDADAKKDTAIKKAREAKANAEKMSNPADEPSEEELIKRGKENIQLFLDEKAASLGRSLSNKPNDAAKPVPSAALNKQQGAQPNAGTVAQPSAAVTKADANPPAPSVPQVEQSAGDQPARQPKRSNNDKDSAASAREIAQRDRAAQENARHADKAKADAKADKKRKKDEEDERYRREQEEKKNGDN